MTSTQRVGRYDLLGEIASGGMATVHYGRVRGAVGFSQIVAIKRLHPHLAKDEAFSSMFLDEARLAARIRHANVGRTLDVVALPEGEILIVMEYLRGEALSRILRRATDDEHPMPSDVALAIVCDVLQGLHAAHEATSAEGEPLGVVHRDASPHNIIVGADGIARVVDFGVAKARGQLHATRDGEIRGKLGYMSPEQLKGKAVDRRSDVFSMGVVLWEVLTGERLFAGAYEGETVVNTLDRPIPPPSARSSAPRSLDEVVGKALSRDPSNRFGTARAMALALESAAPIATARSVASWVQLVAGDVLAERERFVAELERDGVARAPVPAEAVKPAAERTPSSLSGRSRPGRTGTRRVAAAGLLAAASTVAVLAVGGRARNDGTAAPPSAAASPAASPSIAAPPSAAASPAVSPSIAAPPSAAASPSTGPRASGRRAPPASAAPPAPSAKGASSAMRCSVTEYIDKDGYVHFQKECP